MKFPWFRFSDGVSRPALRCGFRRLGTVLPSDMLVIVDTGADVTVLPFAVASLLGFSTSDLEGRDINAVGGKAKTWTTKGAPRVEVGIGGHWLMLPALAFAENTPPLLGRDVLFSNFDLRMTGAEIELREKSKKP